MMGGVLLPCALLLGAEDAWEREAAASHERMIRELDAIEAVMMDENPYVGDLDLRRAQARVEAMGPDTPPTERGIALGYVGYYQLCFGLEEEAIANLKEALSLFPESSDMFNDPDYATVEGTLSLAWMRLAESENCCAIPSPESCVFPIQGEGVHAEEEGAIEALKLLKQNIPRRRPDELVKYEEKWLVNLATMILGREVGELPESWQLPASFLEGEPSGFPVFRNVGAEAGINTFGLAGGAVVDDLDGDGEHDLLVSNWDPSQGMRLFLGGGDGTFVDQTATSNLDGIRGGLNLKQGDFDNDGDLDIYVMRGAWLGEFGDKPNSLLRNNGVGKDGQLTFTDVTFAVGLGDAFFPTQTGDWADFDLDGDLDLFVGAEGSQPRFPCRLYRNDGPNALGIPRFTEIGREAGIQTFAYVKGVSWGDYDQDRYPDIYLSCITGENFLYRNQGNGTFTDVTSTTNTKGPRRSFPTWFWDYNNDGLLDLFVSDYNGKGWNVFKYKAGIPHSPATSAALYQNRGGGILEDVGPSVGLTMPMLPMGSNFGDLTNDGYPDMYLGTGDPDFSSIVPNLMLSNEAGTFVDRTVSSRLGHLQKGHAVSFADFDRDGDLDIFEQMGGAYRCDPYYDALYENPGTEGSHWLSVKLRGAASNRFGVGARVRVVLEDNGKERSLYQWMNSGGSFGANPLELHFGLGESEKIVRVEVFWPATGETQIANDVLPDTWIRITEGGETIARETRSR